MKIRTMLFAAAFTLASLMAASAFAHSFTTAGSSSLVAPKRVYLQCRNYGGQQDVSKNPDIINNTGKTVPTGTKLYWTASDGDKGTLMLQAPLAPNAKVGVIGTAGQSYTCRAWYMK